MDAIVSDSKFGVAVISHCIVLININYPVSNAVDSYSLDVLTVDLGWL
jgi:hypothetical protein